MGDPIGLPVADVVPAVARQLSPAHPSDQGQDVVAPFGHARAPPRVPARGGEDQLVPVTQAFGEEAREGRPNRLLACGSQAHVVHEQDERGRRGPRGAPVGRGATRDRLGPRHLLVPAEVDGLEARDRLGLAVLADREIVPGEPGNRAAVLVEYDRVDRDQVDRRGERRHPRLLLPEGEGPHDHRRREQRKAHRTPARPQEHQAAGPVLQRTHAPGKVPDLAGLPGGIDEVGEGGRPRVEQGRGLVAHHQQGQEPERVPGQDVRAEEQGGRDHGGGRGHRLRAARGQGQGEENREEGAETHRVLVIAGQRGERREQGLVEAPEARELREAQEERLARAREIGQCEESRHRRRHQHLPRAIAPGPGRGHEPGQELGLEAESRRNRRGQGPSRLQGGHRPGQEQEAEGLVVPAPRDLDEGQGAPGQDEQPLPRQAPSSQEDREGPEGEQLARRQERLHGRDRVVEGDHAPAGELEERRVDGRIILVVQPLPYRVPQALPARGVGAVPPGVGVPAMNLDSALPDVTVHVVAQEGRREDEGRAPGDGQPHRHPEAADGQSVRAMEGQEVGGEGQAVEREVRGDARGGVAPEGPGADTKGQHGAAGGQPHAGPGFIPRG